MKIKLTKSLLFGKNLITNLMRIFILLFCTAVFSSAPINLFSQNEKIVVDANKTITVDQVFEMIKSQTNYSFIYQEDMFKNAPNVHLKKGKIKLNQLLEISLSNGNYQVGFDANDNIFIRTYSTAIQSDVLIKGTIIDDNGIPVAGATIIYKDFPNRGTASDFDGKYQILVNEGGNATLQFSSVGYLTQEIKIGNRIIVDVIMKDSTTSLEEVVIVGYGSVKRQDLTGSVGTIKAKDLMTTSAATSFDQLLGGKLSGVSVMQSGGAPGSMSVVNIRGLSAVRGDNQPLYVIDGVPVITQDVFPESFPSDNTNAFFNAANPLLAINPNDIESIDVLKDASAAAIYGSRAANGVIIVTTKRGKKNQEAQIEFSYSLSATRPVKRYDWMNAQQWRAYQTTVAQNTLASAAAGNNFADTEFADIVLNNERVNIFGSPAIPAGTPFFGDKDTNWDDFYENKSPFVQQYNLSVTGGSKASTYSLAAHANSNEGTYKDHKLNSYGFRASLDVDAKDWLSLGGTFNYNINKNNSTGITSPMKAIFNPTFGPDDFVYDVYGGEQSKPDGFRYVTNETKSSNVIGNVYGKLRVIKNLELKTELAFSLFNSEGISMQSTQAFGERGRRSIVDNKTDNTTLTNTLAYNNTFMDTHNVNAVLGNAWDIRNVRSKSIGFSGFVDDYTNNFPGPTLELFNTNEGEQQAFLNSYFARVNYDFNSRYYLTLSGRFDGSDKFGINNRWGFFPAAAVAWRISNEDFLNKSEIISNLKLRASLGRTGNNTLEGFQDTFLYGSDPDFFMGSIYNGINGLVNTVVPNPDVKWETTQQMDVAIDFGLFKNRLNGSVGYYSKDTKDFLAFGTLPQQTGFASQIQNVGRIKNSGLEIELSGDIIRSSDFSWTSSFNISFNDNILKELNDASIFSDYNPDEFVVGKSLGNISGYVIEGVIKTQAEADALNALVPAGESYAGRFTDARVGAYRFQDTDGNGYINTDDFVSLGNTSVDYFGGWSNTITYKGFNLYFDFQFSGGNEREDGFNSTFKYDHENNRGDGNNIVGILDSTWSPDNPDATYEQAIFGGLDFLFQGARSINVFDASYVRFKTLRIGYSFPSPVLDKLGIGGLNISLTANNLATWTDWPGLDPESISGRGGISGTTKAFEVYPLTRTFSLGVNVKL